jgi:hypothetical protein
MQIQHATLSTPVTEIIHRAVADFTARSSATPRFCYLPNGLLNDVEDAVRDELERLSFGLTSGLDVTIVSYLGLTLRRSNGHNIVISEAPL